MTNNNGLKIQKKYSEAAHRRRTDTILKIQRGNQGPYTEE
jgi:hypothetical protein